MYTELEEYTKPFRVI